MQDIAGKEIRPGQWIVYGMAIGSAAGIQIGLVVATQTKVRNEGEYTPAGHRITVVRVERGWRDGTLTVAENKSTVYTPERTLVVSKDTIPFQVQCQMNERLDAMKIKLPKEHD